MWKISQKRDIGIQAVYKVLKMDFLNCMKGAEKFCSPHLKWQLECRGKVVSHSLFTYFPLVPAPSNFLTHS